VTSIAVIIPCFDEPLVAAAVASIDIEVELVIVDDGSEDPQALAALARLEATGVRVIRQPNQGVAAARMHGVRETSAPYVFALDADDWLALGALAALAAALDAEPTAALAWGDLVIENGKSFYRPSVPLLDPWFMAYVNAVPACSLVRRSDLVAVGGWQETVGPADKDLWLRFAEQGRNGVYLPRPIYHYRADGGGMFIAGIPRYDQRQAAIVRNHGWLFDHLPAWRRRSPVPRRLKLAFWLLDRLPLRAHRHGRYARALFHLLWTHDFYCAWHYFREGSAPIPTP
jgi:glycosyltransferase involved in cell wall biosynthesis